MQPPGVLGLGPRVLRGVEAAGNGTTVNARLRARSAEGSPDARKCPDTTQQSSKRMGREGGNAIGL